MRKRLSQLCEGELYTLLHLEYLKAGNFDLKSCIWVRGAYDSKKGRYLCFKYFDNDFKVYNHANKVVFVLDDVNSIYADDNK